MFITVHNSKIINVGLMSFMYFMSTVYFYLPSLAQSKIDCKLGSIPQMFLHQMADLGYLGFKKSILFEKAIGIVLQVLQENWTCVFISGYGRHMRNVATVSSQRTKLNTYIR